VRKIAIAIIVFVLGWFAGVQTMLVVFHHSTPFYPWISVSGIAIALFGAARGIWYLAAPQSTEDAA